MHMTSNYLKQNKAGYALVLSHLLSMFFWVFTRALTVDTHSSKLSSHLVPF